MNKLVKLSTVAAALFSVNCMAEIAIVVNPANGASVDEALVKRIFLGKAKVFGNGNSAKPVNQKAIGNEFNKKVLGKSSSQLKAYWSKLVFTGKGTPPKQLNSDADVLKFVAENPNAIGYVDSASVNGSVKVAAKF